jgi:hypothetical protein
VTQEALGRDAHVVQERVRFLDAEGERTLAFRRFPRDDALEAELLPFLARRTTSVPRVYARGLPPRHLPAKAWVLTDDLIDAPSACELDPRDIVDAKVAVERSLAGDEPALRAVGVPFLPPRAIADAILAAGAPAEHAADAHAAADRLADWPVSLVHGDLSCASARVAAGGVLLVDWRRAHLGCALLDVARLTADLVARGDAVRGIGLVRHYAGLTQRTIGTDELRAAELLEKLFSRHVRG